MTRTTKQKGNTLALVVVCIGIIALLVAFFALNYGQLMGTHKEAQTAIDAAALQVARDMGRICIVDPNYGNVALCDDVSASGLNARPVLGINTILATARLDAIISDSLNNLTMQALAKNDLTKAQTAANSLRTAITNAAAGGTARDKAGTNNINLLSAANAAYDANSRRLGKGRRIGAVAITVGRMNPGFGETNIPVPTGDNRDLNSSNQMQIQISGQNVNVYRPYVQISTNMNQTGGGNIPVTFTAVANEPKLLDNNQFVAGAMNGVPPSVVQVSCTEEVNAMATDKPGKDAGTIQHRIQAVATAQAGGPRAQQPSGTLCVSFRQGLPPDNSNLPGNNISFASVRNIMNGSQLAAPATISSPAQAGGWNGVGNWFQVTGGGWPSAGGSLTQPPGGAFNSRNSDNGSVSLSFMVYDWLRSLGLRPRVTAVTGALSFNFRNFIGGSSAQPPAGQQFSMNQPDVICAPAYAIDATGQLPVSGGIFCVGSENAGVCSADQRDFQLSSGGNPTLAQLHGEQTSNVIGYRPTDVSFGPDVKRISIDESGAPKTTSGDDVGALFDLQRALGKAGETGADLQTHCATSYTNANTVLATVAKTAEDADAEAQRLETELNKAKSDKAAAEAELATLDPNNTQRKTQLEKIISDAQAIIDSYPTQIDSKKAERDNARKGQKRANYVKTNANHASLVGISILENLGALTAIGYKIEIPGKKFLLAGSVFVPPMKAATVDEIKGEGAIATGRESGGPGEDNWAVQPNGANGTTGEGGTSLLTFYQHQSTPVIGHRPDPLNGLMQPALAQGAIPANGQLMFFFNVLGDVTNVSSPGGQVRFTAIPTSPFINMNTLPGQVHYQSVSALRTRAPGSTADVLWTAQARDNNAFGGTNAGYFADTNGVGYNMGSSANYCQQSSVLGTNTFGGGAGEVCPSLVTEWQIGCPTPVPPGGSCGVDKVVNPDGTVEARAITCPPPPPQMG